MIVPSLALALGVLAATPWTVAGLDIPIVGPRSGLETHTGEVPIRRDINSLYEEAGPQWDLYVEALTAMQDANETDPTSYFQIAGIHGQPYMAWAGGGPQSGADAGYCPHNQMLFGTWHRAYLSLYEQILVEHARRIAAAYPAASRRKYVEAAESLRLAYWDWADNSNVPAATTKPTVVVNKAVNGTLLRQTTVRNPLFSYKYPKSVLKGDFGKFDGTNHTKRCVGEGQSYPDTANGIMAGYNLKEKVYNVFLRASSFDEMVSTQSRGANFEGPHGEVHVAAACGHDLVYLSTSAFEPLFWLHHTNVDRLIAYWQALHFDNSTMHFSYPANQLFATPWGTITTPQSPMQPFIGRKGPLTSESVTRIQDWGYTYAPIRPWDQAQGETKMAVSRTVNSLYGPRQQPGSSRSIVSNRRRRSRAATSRTEYLAKVQVERGELDLPCQVQLYLKGGLAGAFTLLDMPRNGMSYEEVPLQRSSVVAMSTGGSPAKAVLDSIDEELEVVIKKLDGTEVPLSQVPSLQIELEDVEVISPSTLNELPTLGKSSSRSARIRAVAASGY